MSHAPVPAAPEENLLSPTARPPAMTEEQFVDWCDEDVKAEWLDGEVVVMSPSNVEHVRLAGFLLRVLSDFAEQQGMGEVFGPELQVRLPAQRRRRVPDILFVATARRDILRAAHVEGPPDLIIEIVSRDSDARDWRDKYLEYEAAGVREYWVVDPMSRHLEAYVLTDKGYSRLEERSDAVHSKVLPGLYLRPSWLWREPLPRIAEVMREIEATG